MKQAVYAIVDYHKRTNPEKDICLRSQGDLEIKIHIDGGWGEIDRPISPEEAKEFQIGVAIQVRK
jgi:hypothetical protein